MEEMAPKEIEEAFKMTENRENNLNVVVELFMAAPLLVAFIGLLVGIGAGVCVRVFDWIAR